MDQDEEPTKAIFGAWADDGDSLHSLYGEQQLGYPFFSSSEDLRPASCAILPRKTHCGVAKARARFVAKTSAT